MISAGPFNILQTLVYYDDGPCKFVGEQDGVKFIAQLHEQGDDGGEDTYIAFGEIETVIIRALVGDYGGHITHVEEFYPLPKKKRNIKNMIPMRCG